MLIGRVIVLSTALCIGTIGFALAQVPPISRSRGLRAVHTLDAWVVTRFQHAQLLPDSLPGRSAIEGELAPRVESVSDASTGDTLYAVQFRTRRELSSVRTGARVRLTGPSGSITTITADIIARRPFRALRRPGATSTSPDGWRYGWAYLALVRRRSAPTPASVYRGWLLLDVPDSSGRR